MRGSREGGDAPLLSRILHILRSERNGALHGAKNKRPAAQCCVAKHGGEGCDANHGADGRHGEEGDANHGADGSEQREHHSDDPAPARAAFVRVLDESP